MATTLAAYDRARLAKLSLDRRAASSRVLGELERMCGGDLSRLRAETLADLLDCRTSAGQSPATLRKVRAVVLSFARWAVARDMLDAHTLYGLTEVSVPGGQSHTAGPQPYNRNELWRLRKTLDGRWPLLADDEAARWLGRYRDGRSPYSRIRPHIIRAQLDAMIALALYQGLRRREIRGLSLDAGHSDNDQVVVFRDAERSTCRLVPYTDQARATTSRWVYCRWVLGPAHRSMWLNLHAGPTAREPITHAAFAKVLHTYVGAGWTFKRLRDTCAVTWVRAGLPLEHVRQLLGLSRIEDVLPYARLVRGSLDQRMGDLDDRFCSLLGPVSGAPAAA